MKRHEAIAPLSRDHHDGLMLAQLLKKDAPVYRDMPVALDDKVAFAQNQFKEHMHEHFIGEEKMLEMVRGINEEIDMLAEQIKGEHKELTALFQSLDESPNLPETLNELAEALQKHIRKEERVLFPLIQEHCSEEKLQEIYTLLH